MVPGSAGAGPAIEALSREAKRRCPAATLVHIEGAWNHGEKAGRADVAEARRRAARGRGPLRRNRNFVHRRHVLSKTW